METTKFYRIQGGKGYNSSREMLIITKENQLEINTGKIHSNIHIGDLEHMKHFIRVRLGVKSDNEISEEDDFSDRKIEIIEMNFPIFFKKILEENSIPQFISTAQNPLAPPQIVDELSPGNSYALKSVWNLIMKECCLYATRHVIRRREDILEIINSKSQIAECNTINTVRLNTFLKKAGIDIKGIKQINTEICEINTGIEAKKERIE